jgi:hypothetical protein
MIVLFFVVMWLSVRTIGRDIVERPFIDHCTPSPVQDGFKQLALATFYECAGYAVPNYPNGRQP